jgi:hypothetical protein
MALPNAWLTAILDAGGSTQHCTLRGSGDCILRKASLGAGIEERATNAVHGGCRVRLRRAGGSR